MMDVVVLLNDAGWTCGRLAGDSGVRCCVRSPVPLSASNVDDRGARARVQTPVRRLRQLQAATDCRSHQR